ncbi:MAG: DUF4236 domain-containing protein, partial [Clostridia bacterium]|nr:DUF4236 domain-containing protein [Clostridia bacterium]
MGLRYRKSYKSGPFRVTISKSGVGWSVGGKGFRYTKTANGRTRKTYSVPGTGISYVTESGKKNNSQSQTTQKSTSKTTNTDQEWEIYSPLFTKAREIEKENPDTALELILKLNLMNRKELAPNDDSTSKMNESKIVVSLLFIAHEKFSKAV